MSEVHTLTLTRYTVKYLRGTVPGNPRSHSNVIEENQTGIVEACNNKSWQARGYEIAVNPIGHGNDPSKSGLGWSRFSVDHDTETKDEKGLPLGDSVRHRFEMYLRLTQDGKDTDSQQFPRMIRTIYTRAKRHDLGDWYLTAVDGKAYVPGTDDELAIDGDEEIEYAAMDMPDDWDAPFSHLYGLDSQIAMIQSRLFAAVDSEWVHRFNCALVGPPGCGKSDIAKSIADMLPDDAVLHFDATALTGAGAIKELSEREILPRVIIIEEIEKCDPKGLAWLLAALDIRGEIRKVTARANIQRDTKVFCIATVNNVKLFNQLMSGALASRFTRPIYFKRPSRETLAKILKREIEKVNGDEAWVEPALNYCETAVNADGTIGITDPRQVIAICLAGRDALLSGKYQQMLNDTSPDPTVEVYSEESFEDETVTWGMPRGARPDLDEENN